MNISMGSIEGPIHIGVGQDENTVIIGMDVHKEELKNMVSSQIVKKVDTCRVCMIVSPKHAVGLAIQILDAALTADFEGAADTMEVMATYLGALSKRLQTEVGRG